MKTSKRFPLLLSLLALGGALAFFWTREAEVSPLEYIPKRGVQLAVIPSAERFGQDLSRLGKLDVFAEALSLLGQPAPEQLFQDLSQIVGADVRDATSLASIGIAADRPIFVFGPDFRLPALALPVADTDAVEAWLDRVALARLGATPVTEKKLGGHAARLFTVPDRSGPALTSVLHGGYLYLGHGDDGAALLERSFALAHQEALASDEAFDELRRSFEQPSAYARIFLDGWRIGLAIDLDPGHLALHVRLPTLPEATSEAESRIAKLSIRQAAPIELSARLNPEAQFFAQTGIDPTALAALRPRSGFFPRLVEQVLSLLNLDVDRIAAELEPGIAFSARLAPRANLMALASPLGPRGVNPFDIVHVEILALVRDEERARALLDRVASLAPVFGASAQRFTREGRPIDDGDGALSVGGSSARAAIQALASAAGLSMKAGTPDPNQIATRWAYRYRLGEGLTFELDGKRLHVTGGEGVGEALVGREPAAGAPHDIGESGLALHADLGALIANMRALPESSFGIGGFAIKSSLDRWLGAFESLDALRLTASQQASLIHLDASLSLGRRPVTAPAAEAGREAP